MRTQELLEHHGIMRNPFAEEDAQNDSIFKEHCINTTYHPAWDKVFGDPAAPSTAIVFGEKGSGKTALGLQIAAHLTKFGREHPENRTFIISYVDFGHFLDRFRDNLPRRQRRTVQKALSNWRLHDHLDAVLSLGVTDLVDEISGLADDRPSGTNSVRADKLAKLDRDDARDLLLLAACYDHSTSGTFKGRWERLRKALRYRTLFASASLVGGMLFTAATAVAAYFGRSYLTLKWLLISAAILVALGWLPYAWKFITALRQARRVTRAIRIGNRDGGPLREVLIKFRRFELQGQPMPEKDRTEDRYELLHKFQRVLRKFGFTGVVVLFDRLDEPHLINGTPELMKAMLWPMLDNKFLKHDGLGIKVLVPDDIRRFVEKENRDFHERARLDKQNLISSFQWSGESLYDLAEKRMQACAEPGRDVQLADLFDDEIDQQRLIEAFRKLRVPRRLFKFLYQLLSEHCSSHTSQQAKWEVPRSLFETTLAVFEREQDMLGAGVG